MNYATWVSADFYVTHNTKETRCFQVCKDKIPKNLGKELSQIPKASDLLDNKNNAQDEKVFEKDEFGKLLHQCHNIIRNNDKLSPEAAFDVILTNPPFGSRVDKELKITARDNLKSQTYEQNWYKDYEEIINQRKKDIQNKKKLLINKKLPKGVVKLKKKF